MDLPSSGKKKAFALKIALTGTKASICSCGTTQFDRNSAHFTMPSHGRPSNADHTSSLLIALFRSPLAGHSPIPISFCFHLPELACRLLNRLLFCRIGFVYGLKAKQWKEIFQLQVAEFQKIFWKMLKNMSEKVKREENGPPEGESVRTQTQTAKKSEKKQFMIG